MLQSANIDNSQTEDRFDVKMSFGILNQIIKKQV